MDKRNVVTRKTKEVYEPREPSMNMSHLC